jgi:DMSO/TMAO reductase YedYZ heme-binding membrane subunit
VLLDRFVPFGPLDVLIPMHGAFRPVAVAFGIVAMYGAVIVLASSWTRRHLSTKLWRRLHLLAVPVFTLSMVHGIFTGTDTVRPWMWWTYVATGGIVLFLLIVRGLTTGLRPTRTAPPPRARTTLPSPTVPIDPIVPAAPGAR